MAGLLSGLTVLEVGNEFGEWAGRLLADMGASVVKIEPPAGNSTRAIGPFHGESPDKELSLHFWHYNAGKQGITLDLTSEKGRHLFRKLATKSDVLVESLPPGQLAKWELGFEALAQSNPGLIVASISPFGQTGPRRDWAATDLTLLAMGGPMNTCGYDDLNLPPVRPAGGQSYHVAGHFALTGILVALTQRLATGRGQHIDVPIQACLAVTTEGSAMTWLYAGEKVRRQTGRHARPTLTPVTQYLCADGRYVNLHATRDDRPWQELVKWLTEEGIADDLADEKYRDLQVRNENGDHIMAVLSRLCARHSAMEVFQHGQSLGLAFGAVRRPEEWLEDPHTTARGTFVEVEHPEVGQAFRYPGPPFHFSESQAAIRQRAPRLGEHSASVYAELGLTPGDLDRLRADGVI